MKMRWKNILVETFEGGHVGKSPYTLTLAGCTKKRAQTVTMKKMTAESLIGGYQEALCTALGRSRMMEVQVGQNASCISSQCRKQYNDTVTASVRQDIEIPETSITAVHQEAVPG